jgi:hypothetical protein
VSAAPSEVNDDALSTGQGDPLGQLDDVTILETNSQINTFPQDVTVSDITTDPEDGLIEFVAGGQRLIDPEATEFEISNSGLRISPDDVSTQTEIEDGTIVEFTQSGERIVDADNPDFVVTEGGLRVAAEDVDLEVSTEGSDLVRVPTDADIEEAAFAQAALDRARQQASVSALRKANGKAVGDGDWRVRLRLAPNAYYLYKNNSPGIMLPLQETDGVIFPYTPRIDMT